MRIGILEAGPVPEDLLAEHGPYPDMFVRLVGRVDPSFEFESFAVFDDVFPDAVDQCDGWLVTGSKYGAYEDFAWIRRLERFLRDAVDTGVPVVGICFGHQVLAKALGGKVVKAEAGWGVGLHDYEIVEKPSWMKPAADRFVINTMHQDQVVELPPEATVIARSGFCPYAALAYDDKAISFQGHPEFERPYAHDLIATRRGKLVPEATADAALASLDGPTDSDELAAWIARFFLSCR